MFRGAEGVRRLLTRSCSSRKMHSFLLGALSVMHWMEGCAVFESKRRGRQLELMRPDPRPQKPYRLVRPAVGSVRRTADPKSRRGDPKK